MDKSQPSPASGSGIAYCTGPLLFDDSVPSRSLTKFDINGGTFRVTITLRHMWMKSKPLHDTFSLCYTYSPLGIMEKPVTCTARPDPSIDCGDPKKLCSIIYSGNWSEVVSASQILATSQQPILKVEVNYLEDKIKGYPHFAFVEVPIEDIFTQIQLSSENCCTELNGEANLIKLKSNRKFGHVEFNVKVERLPEKKTRAETANMKDSSNIIMSMRREAQKSLDEWKKAEELEFSAKLKDKGKDLLRRLSLSSDAKEMLSNMQLTKPFVSAEANCKNMEQEFSRNASDSIHYPRPKPRESLSMSDLDLVASELVEDSIKQTQIGFIHQEIARLVEERNELLKIYKQSDDIIQIINKKLEVLARHQ